MIYLSGAWRLARRWLCDRTAATGLLVAVAMPVLLGITGLVAEYGNGLARRTELQRIADSAAFAGAVAYNNSVDSGDGTAAMTEAARRIAAFNAVSQGVAVELTASPSGDGNPAVHVSIADSVPTVFSRLITSQPTLAVGSQAYAEVTNSGSTCILSLQAAAGRLTASVGLDGGAVINALLCAVSANAAVTVPCGTGINTARLSFNSALPPDAPCNGIRAPGGQMLELVKRQISDPYAADAAITGARLRLTADTLQLSPLPPVVVGLSNIDFAGNALATGLQANAAGCSARLSGKAWTLTCAGNPTFGTVTVANGYSVDFNSAGAATTSYRFGGAIVNNGGMLTFGSGSFTVAQGIRTAAGSTTRFATAALYVGTGLSACADGGLYSLCNGGTLTISGPTDTMLSAGAYNGAGATLVLGIGAGNAYRIGSGSTGNALHAATGSTTAFADGQGSYQFTGDVVVDGAAGSCLAFGAAPDHDFNGSLRTAGGTAFGAGTYTVTGAVLLGVNGAADQTCSGVVTGVSAQNVAFVVGGGLGVPLAGPCALQAFCVTPGYGNVAVTAPTGGLLAKVAVVGPAANASGALFSSGLQHTSLSGLFYMPLGPVTIEGGAGVGEGLGQCLELVVAQLLVQHGSIFAAPCKNGTPAYRTAQLVG